MLQTASAPTPAEAAANASKLEAISVGRCCAVASADDADADAATEYALADLMQAYLACRQSFRGIVRHMRNRQYRACCFKEKTGKI
eukprot:4192631-Pleurochrysis_carterae.AAC.2